MRAHLVSAITQSTWRGPLRRGQSREPGWGLKRMIANLVPLAFGLAACMAPQGTATTGDDATDITAPFATATSTVAPTTSVAETEDLYLLVEWPPERLVVTTADLVVFGSVSPGANVRAGGVDTTAPEDGVEVDGHRTAYFELALLLDPGANDLAVEAVGVSGAEVAADISVTYLPDAVEEFAYPTRVSETEVVADYAEFLTGDVADAAAIDAGEIAEGEHVPNGYYIRNVDPRLRTLPLDESPVVVLPTFAQGPVTEVNVAFDEWLAMFDDGRPWSEGQAPPGDGFFAPGAEGVPYWLTIHDGVVVQIRQQYLP